MLPIYLMLLGCHDDQMKPCIADEKYNEFYVETELSLPKIFEYNQKVITGNARFPFCLVLINITVRIIKHILTVPNNFERKIREDHQKTDMRLIFLEAVDLFCRTWHEKNFDMTNAQKCLKIVEDYLCS